MVKKCKGCGLRTLRFLVLSLPHLKLFMLMLEVAKGELKNETTELCEISL